MKEFEPELTQIMNRRGRGTE